MAMGIVNECFTTERNKISISVNKASFLRGNNSRGGSTYKSAEKYLNLISNLKIDNNNFVSDIKYNPNNCTNSYIEINDSIIKNSKLMPYNYIEFESLKSNISKHMYLLINLEQLKTNKRVLDFKMSDLYSLFGVDDSFKFLFNKRFKNSLNELKDNKVIKNFTVDKCKISITI